jgi:hypothetical protein
MGKVSVNGLIVALAMTVSRRKLWSQEQERGKHAWNQHDALRLIGRRCGRRFSSVQNPIEVGGMVAPVKGVLHRLVIGGDGRRVAQPQLQADRPGRSTTTAAPSCHIGLPSRSRASPDMVLKRSEL